MIRSKTPLRAWTLRLAFILAAATVIPACGRTNPFLVVVPYSISNSTLAAGVVGVAYTDTLTAASASGAVTWTVFAGSLPAGLNLNSVTGQITGTPLTPGGTAEVLIRGVDAAGEVTQRSFLISITGGTAGTLTVTTSATLPGGDVGTPYEFGFAALNGAPPFAWSVTFGNLPPGILLNPANGGLTGVPTTAGTYGFTIHAGDTGAGNSSVVCSLTIGSPMQITAATMPPGSVGGAYAQPFPLSGGSAPFLFSISSGVLPAGLSLNTATGAISGTPTLAATSGYTIRATDAAGVSLLAGITHVINPAPIVTPVVLPPSTQGLVYSQTLAATLGTGAYSWAQTGGTLPNGLALSAGGVISGTSTAAGTFNFTVTVTDAANGTGSLALSILINPPVVVTNPTLSDWTVNQPAYTQTIAATGGTGIHTWSFTGTIPTGMTLNAATGILSGTPTALGLFSFTATATDTLGATGSHLYLVTINPPPTIATTSLPDWTINRAYSQTLLPTVNTGTPAYAWSLASGTLPAGLSLSSGGVLSGTQLTSGVFTFTVRLTDVAGATATKQFSNLTFNPTPTVLTTSLPNWTIGRPYSQTLLLNAGTGTAPITWAITSGPQPTSLVLSSGGVLSGTPTATGPFTFTVTATDAAGATVPQTYTALTINPTPVLATPLPDWTINRFYSQTLTTGATGTPPFNWTISSGTQPTSLNLVAATGVFSGTPSAAGAFTFQVTVTDAAGATASHSYSPLTINPTPTVATSSIPDWTITRPYSQTLLTTANTGTAPFSWAVSASAPPSPLALSSGGVLSGTPNTLGTSSFTVTVTDAAGATATQSYNNVKINPLPTIATASVPNWTVNRAYPSTTLLTTAATGTPPFTWLITAGPQPTSLSLSSGGLLSGTPSITGTYSFTVSATDAAGAVATQSYNNVVINPPPTIATALPDWTVSQLYSQTLLTNANTGTSPFTWAVTASSPPPPLSLSLGGLLSGTPSTPGLSTFTVTVTDSAGATGIRTYTNLKINPLPTIATTSLPDWTQGFPFSQTLLTTALTGTSPFTWTILSGTQPPPLTLTTGGLLSGTPNSANTYSFTVQVQDAAGATATMSYNNLVINPPLSISTGATLPPWTLTKTGYSQQLAANGGTGAQTWSKTLGNLPTGLSLSSGGLISGQPITTSGTFNFTVQVQDAVGATNTLPMSILINPVPSITSSATLAPWTQFFSGYNQPITSAGGTGGNSYSIISGGLPNGMSINGSTGAVTGNPNDAFTTYGFTVRVQDTLGVTGSLAMSILINQQPNISPSNLPSWTQSRPYSQSVTGNGGTGALTYSIVSGALPTNLTMDSAGAVTGTPNVTGPFNFSVKVQDSIGANNTVPVQININPPPIVTTGATLPDAAINTFYNLNFSVSGGTGPYNWTPVAAPPLQTGLSLSSGGNLSGVPSSSGGASFSATVTDAAGSSNTLNLVSLFVVAPLTVTTSSLTGATANTAYSASLSQSGGKPGYTWSLLSGTPPTGINLSAGGAFSGTAPNANGTSAFVVKVTDTDGRIATQALSITVSGALPTPLSIDTVSLNAATQGSPYNAGLAGSGGVVGSYQWTISAGTMPSGLSLDINTGIITGTPGGPALGFTVQLFDGTTTVTKGLSIAVNPPLSVFTGSPLPAWTINRGGYTGGMTQSGGTAPFSWSVSSGAPPTGMSLSSAGTFTGTPSAAGTFSFTAQVTDAAGAVATKGMSLTINDIPTFQSSFLAAWDKDLAGYSFTPAINNGTQPYAWIQLGGTMPAGLSIAGNGLISGTPTNTGTFNPSLQATDAAGAVISQVFTININLQPGITTGATLPTGTEGQFYSQSVSGNNGTGSLSFALTGGTLPTGVTFSGSTFSGTPGVGTAATYNPKITVTDSAGGSNSVTFTLVVTNGPTVSNSNPPNTLTPPVNLDTNLVLTFNMAMVKSEVESRFSLSPLSVSAVHSYFWDTPPINPNGTTLTVVLDTTAPFGVISGDDRLVENTPYTWSISSGAHSGSSLVMPAQTGQFQTIPDGTPPALSTITPDPRVGILTNVTGFVLVFNEPMNTSGSNGSTQVQVEGGSDQRNFSVGNPSGLNTVVWTNSTTLTITLNPALTANTGYRLQIQSLNDAAGNYMNNNPDFNVVTSGSASAPPFVTGNFPVDTSTGVSRDAAIFIGVSEALSPNVLSVLSITGTTTPVQMRYELGKSDGPQGISITPKVAWPANTTITVTIPTSVTNASGVHFASPFSFTFTTGATGVGTNPIVIDDPFSSIKNGMVDCNTFNALQGALLFKDSVTGARVYLDASTLVNSAISVTDPNGLPVKLLVVNSSGSGGDDPGSSLQITNAFGQGTSSLDQGKTYTMVIKSSILGSTGQSFAGATYTFTTVPDSNTLSLTSARFDNFNANTGVGPTRTLDVQVDLNQNSGGTFIQSIAAAVAGNTDYTSNGFVPGWIAPGATVAVSGCNNSLNNGTFTVVSVTGPGPSFVIRLNNASGVFQGTGGGQMGPPYGVALADVTGSGNTFSTNLTLNNGNFQYQSSGDESTIVTSGDHTFQYTVTDGVPAHTFVLNQQSYFFTGVDMSALTLVGSSPPGGLNPTYSWSGTTPASVTALFIQIKDTVTGDKMGWVIPPSSTSFTQPANFPLTLGDTYKWTLGFLHSGDGTIRDNQNGNGQLNQVSFSR